MKLQIIIFLISDSMTVNNLKKKKYYYSEPVVSLQWPMDIENFQNNMEDHPLS